MLFRKNLINTRLQHDWNNCESLMKIKVDAIKTSMELANHKQKYKHVLAELTNDNFSSAKNFERLINPSYLIREPTDLHSQATKTANLLKDKNYSEFYEATREHSLLTLDTFDKLQPKFVYRIKASNVEEIVNIKNNFGHAETIESAKKIYLDSINLAETISVNSPEYYEFLNLLKSYFSSADLGVLLKLAQLAEISEVVTAASIQPQITLAVGAVGVIYSSCFLQPQVFKAMVKTIVLEINFNISFKNMYNLPVQNYVQQTQSWYQNWQNWITPTTVVMGVVGVTVVSGVLFSIAFTNNVQDAKTAVDTGAAIASAATDTIKQSVPVLKESNNYSNFVANHQIKGEFGKNYRDFKHGLETVAYTIGDLIYSIPSAFYKGATPYVFEGPESIYNFMVKIVNSHTTGTVNVETETIKTIAQETAKAAAQEAVKETAKTVTEETVKTVAQTSGSLLKNAIQK